MFCNAVAAYPVKAGFFRKPEKSWKKGRPIN
jgi:hypothetical protein